MIAEQTKAALQALFPEPDAVPEPPVAEEQVEASPETDEQPAEGDQPVETPAEPVETEVEEGPRENGVLERDYSVHGYHLDAQVDPDQLIEAVTILDKAEFFIETITGVDWIEDDQYEIIYDFSRYDFDLCRVVIRTRVSRQEPVVPTITPVYAGANWHERETHDFFGIKFSGHPHLIPLLLPEDADFHPLRKDFKA
ncbi:NADH-quinone oxidoreductase subunit C [Desulfopila sp. IMCC35008]|uniref:NADH-quinone oxidoreductase subunit C n=1 Tax=Desulfopila sp. IMCC35008 TaxID=2653858 RepID=UPI0013D5EB24|nr:NADH-quinone oxidoreductase subunit C [Desulfopila sp. IMCC35008]